MSAFGGKADLISRGLLRPLLTQRGHEGVGSAAMHSPDLLYLIVCSERGAQAVGAIPARSAAQASI